MMYVILSVSVLAAVSFQKHLLHRLSLGNLRSCAKQTTLDAEAPCASLGHSTLKPTILWRGILYELRSPFHHMFLKDWNHQTPATILFPGFFLLSTANQETNV